MLGCGGLAVHGETKCRPPGENHPLDTHPSAYLSQDWARANSLEWVASREERGLVKRILEEKVRGGGVRAWGRLKSWGTGFCGGSSGPHCCRSWETTRRHEHTSPPPPNNTVNCVRCRCTARKR